MNKNSNELQELQEIKEILQIMQQDIQLIKTELKIIKKETHKMDEHVDFVNNIYDKVKSPFHYILNKVEYLRGNSIDDINNNTNLLIDDN